jgi:hypothetical protein
LKAGRSSAHGVTDLADVCTGVPEDFHVVRAPINMGGLHGAQARSAKNREAQTRSAWAVAGSGREIRTEAEKSARDQLRECDRSRVMVFPSTPVSMRSCDRRAGQKTMLHKPTQNDMALKVVAY